MDPEATAYNMAQMVPLPFRPDRVILKRILTTLIQRHESLRTSFTEVDNEPVQLVHDTAEADIEFHDFSLYRFVDTTGLVKPFDLSRAPLLRSAVIKFPAQPGDPPNFHRYGWFVDMHHIISDGTSYQILVNDFLSLYTGKRLPPLKLQYKDYSQWQHERKTGGNLKRVEKFWLNQFKDNKKVPRLQLPADLPRPPVFTFQGAHYSFSLEPREAAQFRDLGTRNGGTLFMAVLAVLNALFYKTTGQTDIIIGTGIAGRPHSDLERIIGMFVNTLAMRNFPGGGQTFRDLLKTVISRSSRAFEHQDMQFDDLVDKLALKRDGSRNPLFDVCMVVQNFTAPGSPAPGPKSLAAPVPPPNSQTSSTSKFDMTFFVFDDRHRIFFDIEYYTGVYRESTIRRLGAHFKAVVKAVTRDPLIKLDDIRLITAEEKAKVLYTFNRTQKEYPTDQTVLSLFDRYARQSPHRIALACNDQFLTAGELRRRAFRIARYLLEDKKLRSGEPVGIWMSPGLSRPAAVLGILAAGGAFVPIDPDLPPERVKYIINDANIRVMISGKIHLPVLNRLQWECSCFHHFLCLDSRDIYNESEPSQNELMDPELWRHVAETSQDHIAGGGWISSFTGQPMSPQEMDEYGDNVLKKLERLLNPNAKVLEIGCATGITMFRIAPLVRLYCGTDLSPAILEKNKRKIEKENIKNIKLACLPAHEISRLPMSPGENTRFDLVIINSVIQCFPGHNYLRRMLTDCIKLLKPHGHIFIGDIMDPDKKKTMIGDLTAFKYASKGPGKTGNTKTDFHSELFVAQGFWQDLDAEWDMISGVELSGKIHTIENELTKYRYDSLLSIDKTLTQKESPGKPLKSKRKHQDDARALDKPAPGDFSLPAQTDPESIAYIIYTSGTTGRPKGVAVAHRGLLNLCMWHNRYYNVTQNDRAFAYARFGFDASVWEFFPYLIAGVPIHIFPQSIRLDIPAINNCIENRCITIGFLPTRVCEQFMEYPNSSLRALLTGGEKLRVFIPRTYTLHNNYGPTENTVVTTTYPVTQPTHNIPIGKPIDNTKIFILNPHTLHHQPIGIPGELYISGYNLAHGYVNNPEMTAGCFFDTDSHRLKKRTSTDGFISKNGFKETKEHQTTHNKSFCGVQGRFFQKEPLPAGGIFYKSGDLARWLQDGNIEFLGRVDRQVKIRGVRIETREIEARLLEFPGVVEAVVDVRFDSGPDDGFLCAYVMAKEKIETGELKEFLGEYLPSYMVPAFFVFLDRLPLNRSGKIDRAALPAPRVEGSGENGRLRTALEKKLAGLWCGILNLEPSVIGRDDSFFDLGGHSLKATILVSRIHKEMNVKLPLTVVFEFFTLGEQAAMIGEQLEKTSGNGHEPIPLAELKEYYPLSSAQKRLFIMHRMEHNDTRYNESGVIPLPGKPDLRRFEETFRQMISRHESLRTRFQIVGDQPVQVVLPARDVPFTIETVDAPPSADAVPAAMKRFVRPFDLSKAPLFRAAVVEGPGGNFFLLFDMHHIISDGVSNQVFIAEFNALFDHKKLPVPRVQYKDYALWEINMDASGQMAKMESYWLNQLSGPIPRLNLLQSEPLPGHSDAARADTGFLIDAPLHRQLTALAEETGATLFMILLTVYYILLSKYTGLDDIVVGTGIAGRRHADLQNVIGLFVNMLALRARPIAEKTFKEFLQEVKDTALNAYENQEYPFDKLVEALGVTRKPGRNPVFDTQFTFHNIAGPANQSTNPPPQSPEPGQPAYTFENRKAQFDLSLTGGESPNAVAMSFQYNSALFDPTYITGMANHYLEILEQVITDNNLQIKNIRVSLDLQTGESVLQEEEIFDYDF